MRSVRKATLLAGLIVGASACLDSPGLLPKGSARLSTLGGAEKDAGLADGPVLHAAAAGVLSVGTEVVGELETELLKVGLTKPQASAMTIKAQSEVRAGALSIESDSALRLAGNDTESSPIVKAGPLVVKGAVAAVDDDEVGLALEMRGVALQAIVASSFKSLGGRTAELDNQAIAALSGVMVTTAVTNLANGGFSGDDLAASSRAITTGAAGALGESGIEPSALNSVVSAIVDGAVTSFSTLSLSPEQITSVVAGAADGAVSGVSTAGFSAAEGVSAVGAAIQQSCTSLKSYALDSTAVSAAVEAIANNAVGALKGGSFGGEGVLVSALKAISSSAVSGLQAGGFSKEIVANGVSDAAAGGLRSLSQNSEGSTLASGGLANAVLSGALEALSHVDSISKSDKSAVLSSVVGKSVASIGAVGSAATRDAVLSELVSSAVSGLGTLGISDLKTIQTTLQDVGNRATQALATAGYSASTLGSASKLVTAATVKGIDSIPVADASAAKLQDVVSAVVSGVASGLDQLQSSGQITAAVRQSSAAASSAQATTSVGKLSSIQALPEADRQSITESAAVVVATKLVKAVLAYSQTSWSIVAGNSVTMTPAAAATGTGGIGDCTVSPTLPTGLTLSSQCVVRGAATAATAAATYTVTPINAAGNGQPAVLTIAVSRALQAPKLLYLTSAPLVAKVGAQVNLAPILVDGNGSAIIQCGLKSSSAALPTGLTINKDTCAVTGTALSLLSTASFAVVATNADGLSSEATLLLRVDAGIPYLVFSTASVAAGTAGQPLTVAPTLVPNGAAVTACGAKPGTTLPAWITVDQSSCVLSGTPPGAFAASTFLLVAQNSAGSSLDASVTLAAGAAAALGAPTVSCAALSKGSKPTWTWSGGSGFYRFQMDSSNFTGGGSMTGTVSVTGSTGSTAGGGTVASASTGVSTTSFSPANSLTDGAHTLFVQTVNAGTWSASGSCTIVIDTTPPAAPTLNGPNTTNLTMPTWTWASGGSGNGSYRLKLDDPDLTTGATFTSALSYTPGAALANGSHVLYVSERDDAGNWSSLGAYAIYIDQSLPNPPSNTSPSTTASVTPSWSWTSGGGGGNGTYRLKIDSCSLATGATQVNDINFTAPSALAEGAHYLCIQELNTAGSWSGSATFALIIDTAAPILTLTTTLAATTNEASPWVIDLSSSEDLVDLSLGAIDVQNGTLSSMTVFNGHHAEIYLSPNNEGSVVVSIAAGALHDSAGNPSAYVGLSRTYDATPPSAPTVYGDAATNSLQPTWTWTSVSGGNGVYRYKLDSSDFSSASAITSVESYTPASNLSPGAHVLYVQARDAAGNWSSSGSFSTVIDVTAPDATITTTTAAASSNPVWTLTVSFSELIASVSTASFSVTNGSISSLTAAGSLSLTLVVTAATDGAVTVTLPVGSFSDSVGNANTAPASISLSYDSTGPNAPSVTGTSPIANATPTWSWSSGGGGGNAQFRYKLDDSDLSSGTTVTTATSFTPSPLSDGSHTLYVQERDAVGNWSSQGSFAIAIDTTAPTATLSGAPSGASPSTGLSVTVGGTTVASYRYKVISGSSTGCSSGSGYSSIMAVASLISSSIAGIADGSVTLCVLGRDSLGNEQTYASATTTTWTKDTTPPPALAGFSTLMGRNIGEIDINLGFASISDYHHIAVRMQSGASPPASCAGGTEVIDNSTQFTGRTYSVSGLTSGTNYAFRACVWDAAGNVTSSQTSTSVASGSRIFVTSATFNGDLRNGYPNGLLGADARCQQAAAAASQPWPGFWRAILSDPRNAAKDRLAIPGSIWDTSATPTQIAATAANFWGGTHGAAIQKDENGAAIGSYYVWTGTLSNGLADLSLSPCASWTSNLTVDHAEIGLANQAASSWTASTNTGTMAQCNSANRLYCMQQKTPGLLDFAANTSPSNYNQVDLSMSFPTGFGAAIQEVRVYKTKGAAAPPSDCTTSPGTSVATFGQGDFSSSPLNYTDYTSGNGVWTYRACVIGQDYNLATTHVALALHQASTAYDTVFISSKSFLGGELGGLSGAHATCNKLAEAAGLPSTGWKALLSDSTTAATSSAPIAGATYNTSSATNAQIATTAAYFWSGTLTTFNSDEFGNAVTGQVWTGANSSGGVSGSHCFNWTNSTSGYTGTVGIVGASSTGFSNSSAATCNLAKHIMCVHH